MNAIMSPTCSVPRSIRLAPNHSIMIVTAYMMNIIIGIMNAIGAVREQLRFHEVVVALLETLLLNFSRWNARTTGRPVRISR